MASHIRRVSAVDLAGRGAADVFVSDCPLPEPAGGALGWLLEGAFGADDKPDLFVTVAAKGLLEDVAGNRFAWAEVARGGGGGGASSRADASSRAGQATGAVGAPSDGQFVSAAWTMTPRDDPRVGSLGEVFTLPEFRGQGLAPAVCAALLERFDAEGGRWMFLGTSNPSAARIYGRLGFEPYPRGLMRREGPGGGGFDAEWWAPSEVRVRPIHWGDVPRIVTLYAEPNPWLSISMMEGLFSVSHVIHDRCNSLFKNTWQATRAGAWLGLVNATGALVGSAAMEPRGNEKAVVEAEVDLFVHPAFVSQAGVLLAGMLSEARSRGWRWLHARLGEADEEKRVLLEAAGFREVGRLADALLIGGRAHDVRILRLEVAASGN